MEILWSLFVGGLVGWLASLVTKTDSQMGILANVFVGLVGSSLGRWLAPHIGLVPKSRLGRAIVALGGAVLLVALLKAVRLLH